MSIKGFKKKKAIVELSTQQDDTILRLAKKNNLYKVDIIRKLIDMLDGLEGPICIIAYDDSSVALLNDFKDVKNLKKEKDISEFNLDCKYFRDTGVRCDSNFVTTTSFGGERIAQKN